MCCTFLNINLCFIISYNHLLLNEGFIQRHECCLGFCQTWRVLGRDWDRTELYSGLNPQVDMYIDIRGGSSHWKKRGGGEDGDWFQMNKLKMPLTKALSIQSMKINTLSSSQYKQISNWYLVKFRHHLIKIQPRRLGMG